MYQKYYKFESDPFRLAPDPRFSYDHRSYAAAYQHLHEALAQEECFAMVAARPGTGKTTLTQAFVAALDPSRYIVGRLVTTQVDTAELLQLIAYAFALDAEGLDRASTLHRLEQHLRTYRDAGRRALLIVDEAQGLGVEALEQLRLLSNLQYGEQALLQIFLVGQEQLHALLSAPQLEKLQQRIVAVCRLDALSLEEVRDYVHHRLCVAGWTGDPAIDPAAFLLIHRFSQGLPRYINRLCSRLLLHGALEQKHRLDIHDAAAVLLDLSEELLTPVHDQQNLEGNSNRELLYAVAGSGDWHSMLAPNEIVFLEQPPLAPPPLLTTDETTAAGPAATEPSTHAGSRRTAWLRWAAAAAVLVALALPLVAFYGNPVNAIAASVGLLPSEVPPAANTAPVHTAKAESHPATMKTSFELGRQSTVAHAGSQPAPAISEPLILSSVVPKPDMQPKPTGQTAPSAPAEVRPVPHEASTAAENERKDPALHALLAQIQQAMDDDRLTLPRGNSAYDLLRQLDEQHPNHPAVARGLNEIAQRYAVLAKWWMDQGDYGKASRLIARGLSVRPHHDLLHRLRQNMHALALQQQHPSPFPSAFDEGTGSESIAEPARAQTAPKPDLFTRFKQLLRTKPNDEL